MSEQALFGLMAVAQEQQQAVAAQLAVLEQQQLQLTAIIEQARRAVEAMNHAGIASAELIERGTQEAVNKAVANALASVSQAASDSVVPALKAIKGAAGRAQEAEQSLRSAVSWKWAGVCAAASAGLLVVVWSLALLMTPSGSDMAELRAHANDLERRGGKIKLSTCGGRLCARVDIKASESVARYGENGEKWMILDGY